MFQHQIVRLADRPDAVDTVAQWHFDEWGTGPQEPGLEAVQRRLASWATLEGIPCAYVAVVDHEVCGSACLVDHDMQDPPKGAESLRPWLSGVYVKPDSRRTGIGAALVKAVEEAAQVLGHSELYLYTAQATAETFYAPMGWGEIFAPTYEGRSVVIMQKVLGSHISSR
jgi:GNAT superfamily N-acetyltransferase